MRIAIITGQRLHHKQLCARLADSTDVRAIIHPASPNGGLSRKLRTFRNDVSSSGAVLAALRAASRLPVAVAGWDLASDYERKERAAFAWAEAAYDRIDSRLIHRDVDPNGAGAIQILKEADVEAVVTLGGPIYRAPLIAAVPLMINFHTGVSPIYNGASTIDFAYANGHPQICGGTLMVTNAVVDGGDILAHYLPSVEATDTPASLFMKTVAAVGPLARAFVTHLENDNRYARCRQAAPFFYFRSRDWTVYHSQRVRAHLRRGTAARYAREDSLREYWRAGSDEEAERQVEETVKTLLLGT